MNTKTNNQPDRSAVNVTSALAPVLTNECSISPIPLAPAVPTGPIAHSHIPQRPAVDPFMKSRVESLRRKQRSDTFLNSLSLDQALALMDWMSETENLADVLKRIQAKPPNGFGMEVSISTLRRLKASWHAQDLSYSLETMMDTVTDLEDKAEHDQFERVQKVIGTLLHEKAFELACSHPGSTVLKDVLTSIEKLSALEYKRQKLAHEREKHLRQHTNPTQTASSAQPAPRHHRVDLHVIPSPAHPPLPPA